MQKFMKPVISLLSIAFFLVIALATGPDASTNATVAISDCMVKPQVSGHLGVFISYVDKYGDPIPGVPGTLFYTHQEVNDNEECKFSSYQNQQSFVTGPDGKYTYMAAGPYSHDNSEDLYRVEVLLEKTAFFDECKPPVEVGKYHDASFSIKCVGKRLNEL